MGYAKLSKRTIQVAERFIGRWVVYTGDPSLGMFKVFEWHTSGFRLKARRFGNHDEEVTLKTRKMRLAHPEEIAAHCAKKMTPGVIHD